MTPPDTETLTERERTAIGLAAIHGMAAVLAAKNEYYINGVGAPVHPIEAVQLNRTGHYFFETIADASIAWCDFYKLWATEENK